VVELDRGEAMRLLASVEVGRVVFTREALPAIRPVNHLVDAGRVIVRTRLTAKVSVAVQARPNPGVVVAYEADDLDPQRRTGWSVVVIGRATTITDPDQIARYEQLLQPWVNMVMDTVIAIEPQIVTGIRIVSDNHDTH
jgi:nitroimidazol reductase NimA-like FMN-containing flavoprotein (pyridoxamine 5'-phosphate oxidase superfamily)